MRSATRRSAIRTASANTASTAWSGTSTPGTRRSRSSPRTSCTSRPPSARASGDWSALGRSQLVRDPTVHQVVIVLGELARQVVADLEVPRTGRLHRRDLDRGSGEEHLLEALELLWPDGTFVDLDPAAARQVHDRAPGNAVEEAVRRRRVDFPIADKQNIGAGRFGDTAAPVEH